MYCIFEGIHKLPVQWEHLQPHLRERYLDQYREYKDNSSEAGSLETEKMNIDKVLKFINSVNDKTCSK